MVSFCIKFVTTSWTYSTCVLNGYSKHLNMYLLQLELFNLYIYSVMYYLTFIVYIILCVLSGDVTTAASRDWWIRLVFYLNVLYNLYICTACCTP